MENKQKSKLGLGILIGVLIAVIILLTGYIVYDKVIAKDKNNTEEKNQDNITPTNTPAEISKTEPVNLNDEKISALISYIMNVYDNETEMYGTYKVETGRNKVGLFYHKNDKQIIDNIDSNVKLEMLSSKIYNEYMKSLASSGVYEKTFTKTEIDKLYHELFGSHASSIKYTSNTCPTLKEENDKVQVMSSCGNVIGPGFHYSILTQFYKAEKTNDELYLYQLVGYPKYDDENDTNIPHNIDDSFIIYKDYDLTTKTSGTNTNLGTANENGGYNYDLTKIKSELDSYKYTLKLENGNYYFYSVEKEK